MMLSKTLVDKIEGCLEVGIPQGFKYIGISTRERLQILIDSNNKFLDIREKFNFSNHDIIRTLITLDESKNREFFEHIYTTVGIKTVSKILNDPMFFLEKLEHARGVVKFLNSKEYDYFIDRIVRENFYDESLLRDNKYISKEIEYFRKDLEGYGLLEKRYLFIDTETVSLFNKNDYLSGFPVQISYIITDEQLNVINYNDMYINPPVLVSPGAFNVHHLSDGFLKMHGLSPEDSFRKLSEDIQSCDDLVIVGHNIQFDIKVVDLLFRYCTGKGFNPKKTFCTLKYYKSRKDPSRESNKLPDVLSYLGIKQEDVLKLMKNLSLKDLQSDFHSSLFDVFATYMVAYRIKKENSGNEFIPN